MLANNFYGTSAPSGETQVVEAERDLLQSRGHSISDFYRHSDEIRARGVRGTLAGALATPWNPFSARRIKQAVDLHAPDIVHVHNTFPLLSPSIFSAIGDKAARVLTLHNYRLFCPAAIPMRNGEICTECITTRSVGPALRYGCYRNSKLATIPLATNVALHRYLRTWTRQVDAFITLSDFQRELMIDAGLPRELVHVKPNFYPGSPDVIPWDERTRTVVYVGRLSKEKGVDALVHAWRIWGANAPELRIVGDGEMREELKQLALQSPEVSIRFLGQLSSSAAQAEIAQSRLLVLPSQCYEGFPMVIREAFAFGTASAVSNIGPLPSIVSHGENGLVFNPGDASSLLDTIKKVWEVPGELERLSEKARATFEALYTEKVNYKLLLNIYEAAIIASRNRKAL